MMMLNIIKDKLHKILDKNIIIDNKTLSKDEIETIEKKYNILFPSEYKEFLTIYNEVYVKENYMFPMIEKSTITPKDGFESMDYFYSGNLEKSIQDFIDEYGNNVIPIGEAGGDDYICIGIEGELNGKIFYVYHEEEVRNNKYFLIANSFIDFILSFEEHEIECNIDLDEIEIELDSDLWND